MNDPFDYHTCTDSPDGSAVIVFTTEDDGSQRDQIAVVPFYPRGFADKPDPRLAAMRHAEALGEFIRDALVAFVRTPAGAARYEQLKQEVGWD